MNQSFFLNQLTSSLFFVFSDILYTGLVACFRGSLNENPTSCMQNEMWFWVTWLRSRLKIDASTNCYHKFLMRCSWSESSNLLRRFKLETEGFEAEPRIRVLTGRFGGKDGGSSGPRFVEEFLNGLASFLAFWTNGWDVEIMNLLELFWEPFFLFLSGSFQDIS